MSERGLQYLSCMVWEAQLPAFVLALPSLTALELHTNLSTLSPLMDVSTVPPACSTTTSSLCTSSSSTSSSSSSTTMSSARPTLRLPSLTHFQYNPEDWDDPDEMIDISPFVQLYAGQLQVLQILLPDELSLVSF